MNEPEYSIEYHRAHPDVSLEQHVKNRTISLGELVNRKKRVYLDKRFWIIARDVERGEETDANKYELLENLRSKVSSNKIICPISETLFIELYKQSDPKSRLQTIKLIDELSSGIALQPYPQRVATEIAYLFHQYGERPDLCPIENLVWSKISYVFGVVHPTNTAFDEENEAIIQKSFFDHMWEIPLSDIEKHIGDSQHLQTDYEQLAQRLNRESDLYSNDIRSFEGAYKKEMKGAVSLFMPEARRVLEEMFERATGANPNQSDSEKREHEQQLHSFFAALVEKNKLSKLLRTLHITSLCHAAYRWDKQRRLKKNDFLDFYHASAAVGYCDVFLTENPLRSLLLQRNFNINTDYNCQVISSVKEAVECVLQI